LIHKSLVVDQRFPLPARRLNLLAQQLTQLPRGQAEQLIRAGHASVNGRTVRRVDQPLELGDRLEVAYELQQFRRPASGISCRQEIEILYEDPHLLIVNKPPDLLTVPSPHGERTTLVSLLRRRLAERQAEDTLFCVQRLDRGVSGVLVLARTRNIADQLQEQFAERKPQRRYLALVHGRPQPGSGTYRSYLKTDRRLNRYSCRKEEGGELAITHYTTLAEYADTSFVEVWLETGRRNQIRVHFAEAGHPILGDSRYGRALPPHRWWPYRRLALHAESLAFRHPVSQAMCEFQVPLPDEMCDFRRRAKQRPARTSDSTGSSSRRSRRARAQSKRSGEKSAHHSAARQTKRGRQ
jgi:23S rRNA pseudouridine1911/1915/1917 synthase